MQMVPSLQMAASRRDVMPDGLNERLEYPNDAQTDSVCSARENKTRLPITL